MVLTQESVLALLIAEGGRVKKSDLVAKFKDSVNCDDQAEKERNRELFKTFVNNVAFVKEINGVRFVVAKKMYQHLLKTGTQTEERTGNTESQLTGEQQRPPVRTQSCEDAEEKRSPEPDQQEARELDENPSELSPIQLALRRSMTKDFRARKVLSFETQSDSDAAESETTRVQNKPYALPLRVPPGTTRVQIHKLRVDPDDPPDSPKPDPSRSKRRPSVESTCSSVSSPQLRRAVKTRASEESRAPSSVPLEQAEHEWLVKCASGHWSQVLGLLLRDAQLAEKRDFMSGFTALHWAAKCGNSDMLLKITDLSKKGGLELDVNAKTHAGYTPLHIAALHHQEYVLTLLVGELGADPRIRDNCGKRAYHYLHKGSSKTVREMLGEPKVQDKVQEKVLQEKEELDLFPDLSKGFQSISRLFQPHMTGQKKKHKLRPSFYSLSDEPGEEREDGVRHRLMSDAFL
ncbi:ankyrin repeat domain-containing protein SOWAHA [Halichoeres trimaculatus]|uniref:ankyrin repeat domain-containing protein SOWAHA n=1 Tax=Halichoeres trimaculatus TaxID=147232 RepID=UPI003D9FA267